VLAAGLLQLQCWQGPPQTHSPRSGRCPAPFQGAPRRGSSSARYSVRRPRLLRSPTSCALMRCVNGLRAYACRKLMALGGAPA